MMDWRQLEDVVTQRTRAIIPVHLYGHPVEMRPVLDFARRLSAQKRPAWLRYVLVPGLSDDFVGIEKLAKFVAELGNFERVDVLLDVGGDGPGRAEPRHIENNVRGPEVHEIVFELRRPVARKRILDTGARRPTPLAAADRLFGEDAPAGNRQLVAGVGPCGAAFEIDQCTIGSDAESAGDGSKAIGLRITMSGC